MHDQFFLLLSLMKYVNFSDNYNDYIIPNFKIFGGENLAGWGRGNLAGGMGGGDIPGR